MKRMELSIAIVLALVWQCGAAEEYAVRRANLVRDHIIRNNIADPRVVDSIRSVPRHEFVPDSVRRRAYRDMALPIGFGQTISSPYIVARMTERLEPQPTDRVLEVGTGSGYQAAVLSSLVKEVFSVEIVPELGETAAKTLKRLKYENVRVRVGDGYQGWPQHAPFDKIIVTCSPEDIPRPLIEQLANGGHLVIPVGERFQQVLYRFTKTDGKLKKERIESTFFVPMTGVAESRRKTKSDTSLGKLVNGGFEDRTVEGEPLGWYYVRGGVVSNDAKSPQGIRCLTITKKQTERAHALQPVGVDGAKTKSLSIQFWSKGQGVERDLFALQSAQAVVEFYDADRKLCGNETVPLRAGSFSWSRQQAEFPVPTDAKLAMVEVGLFGARGTISFDDVRIETIAGTVEGK